MIPILIIVSMVAFSLIYLLPGDPALAMLGEEQAGDTELYEQLRADLGLDEPLPVQYFIWVTGVLQGDLGVSIRTRESVLHVVGQRLGPTILLGLYATVLSCLIAIPAGVVSALRPNSKLDIAGTIGAIMGASIPNFWLAIILILSFAIWLPWLPVGGYASPLQDPVQHLRYMILPTIALGTAIAALVMRQTRSAVLEVIREDYVRTARAKGLSGGAVVLRPTLRKRTYPSGNSCRIADGESDGRGCRYGDDLFSARNRLPCSDKHFCPRLSRSAGGNSVHGDFCNLG
jgi:peptide/nickel transport system permease protein